MIGGKMNLLFVQLICYFTSITLIDSQSCIQSPSALFLFNDHIYVISQNHSNTNQVVFLNLPSDFDGLPRTEDKDKRISFSLNITPTAVVDTSNLILFFAGDQVALCARAIDSLTCSPPFQLKDYFESIDPAAKVRAATRNSTSLILITEEPYQKVWHRSYTEQFNDNGRYDLTGGHEYIDQTTLPSAMTAVNNTYDKYIVIFNDFWTITAQYFETPVKLDIKSNNQIRLARTFSGCPVDLCFEGDLDAASIDSDGDTYFFRGRYFWNLMSLSKDDKINPPRLTLWGYLDAAFSTSNVEYRVKKDVVTGFGLDNMNRVIIVYNHTISQTFIGYTGTIDAIYYSNGMVYLLSEQTFSSYVVNQSANSFGNVVDDAIRTNSKWPGIPNDIDAAVELPASQEVILFKGSFHYKVSISGGNVKPQLNMNTLYHCGDSVYFSLSKSIGIENFNEFKDYITKFEPTSSVNANQDFIRPYSTLVIIIVVILVMLVLIVAVFIYAHYVKQDDKSLEFEYEPDSNMQASISTETADSPSHKPYNRGLVTTNIDKSINTTFGEKTDG